MISSAQELFFIRVHIPMGMPLRFLVQPMLRILSFMQIIGSSRKNWRRNLYSTHFQAMRIFLAFNCRQMILRLMVGHPLFILHPDIHLMLKIGGGKPIPSFKYWNVSRNTMRHMVQNDQLFYFYLPTEQRLMMLCFARLEINWNHLPYYSMIMALEEIMISLEGWLNGKNCCAC